MGQLSVASLVQPVHHCQVASANSLPPSRRRTTPHGQLAAGTTCRRRLRESWVVERVSRYAEWQQRLRSSHFHTPHHCWQCCCQAPDWRGPRQMLAAVDWGGNGEWEHPIFTSPAIASANSWSSAWQRWGVWKWDAPRCYPPSTPPNSLNSEQPRAQHGSSGVCENWMCQLLTLLCTLPIRLPAHPALPWEVTALPTCLPAHLTLPPITIANCPCGELAMWSYLAVTWQWVGRGDLASWLFWAGCTELS